MFFVIIVNPTTIIEVGGNTKSMRFSNGETFMEATTLSFYDN
jgi:hypothetical protein